DTGDNRRDFDGASAPLGKRRASTELIVFMVGAGAHAQPGGRHLAANQQHRNRVRECTGEGRGSVQYSGTADRQADTGLAGSAGVTVGHARGGLLVAGQDVADGRFSVDGSSDWRGLAAGTAEHV